MVLDLYYTVLVAPAVPPFRDICGFSRLRKLIAETATRAASDVDSPYTDIPKLLLPWNQPGLSFFTKCAESSRKIFFLVLRTMFRTWNQTRTQEAIAIQKSGLPLILLFGGPSAGKATICDLVAQRLGYTHLSMGQLMRHEAEMETPRGKRCKMNVDIGYLCDSRDAHEVLRENVYKHLGRKQPFIVHGYPRDPEQRTAWEADFGKAQLLVFLECPDMVLADRTATRSKNGQRPEDKPETVRKRIQYYVKYTQPMIKDMQLQQAIVRIDANRDIEQVYDQLQKALSAQIK